MNVSVVVPTHNEAENVQPLYQRISAVFATLAGYDFELIFVDDSTDETPLRIHELHDADRRVKLIRLSRRFSQALAITAGLDRSCGDAAIIMDADLQDPPEEIPRLIERWRQGYQVVYVQRPSSSKSGVYRILAKAFYRILKSISSIDIPLDAGEFRLLDRSVLGFLTRLTEHTRFLRGLTVWPGLRQTKIEIRREPRKRGASNYNYLRSLLVAVDGLVSFSVLPLRFATMMGVVVASISILVGFCYVISRWFFPSLFGTGWTSLMVSIAFLSGVQLICMGVIGEYLGRIFIEVQNRPVYWSEYELGFESRDTPADKQSEPWKETIKSIGKT